MTSIVNNSKYSGPTDKPCLCGNPGIKIKNRSPVCDRCDKIEKRMTDFIKPIPETPPSHRMPSKCNKDARVSTLIRK